MTNESPAALSQRYDLVESDYPEWSGLPRRTILVCTQPRSGSTLLGEAMHGAGGCGCPLEYFHRGFRPRFEARWRTGSFADYLQAVYRHRTDPTGTLGVKLFWQDIEDLYRMIHPEDADSVMGKWAEAPETAAQQKIGAMIAKFFPRPIFIHLVRRDALRQAVSALLAEQTQVWRHIPGVQDPRSKGKPAYDYDRIVKLLALGEHSRRSWENFFAVNRLPFHPVAYEELTASFRPTVNGVLAAIGRGGATVPAPRMRRQADSASEEFVARFLREIPMESTP